MIKEDQIATFVKDGKQELSTVPNNSHQTKKDKFMKIGRKQRGEHDLLGPHNTLSNSFKTHSP